MAKDYVIIDRFDGESTFVSKGSLPIDILQELVNLRPSKKVGVAIKRYPYTSILPIDADPGGITDLSGMIEFTNKNGDVIILILDSTTLQETLYTGTYSAFANLSNDERTAGSTIIAAGFNPVIANSEIRSGAGSDSGTTTQRPIWYGYIPARNRYNDDVTIAAGRYLDEQSYDNRLDELIDLSILSQPIMPVVRNYVSGAGFNVPTFFAAYLSPVIDGYQRGFPDQNVFKSLNIDTFAAGFTAQGSMAFKFVVTDTDEQALKRCTALDLFVANTGTVEFLPDQDVYPANFLARIDLNEQGGFFLEKTGTIDGGQTKITITDHVNWLTFAAGSEYVWVYDATNDLNYSVDVWTVNGADIDITVGSNGDLLGPAGSVELKFYTYYWYTDSITGYHHVAVIYDDFYFKLGSAMYDYLNIPAGDVGIPDFRYKYAAWNGSRMLTAGYADEEANLSYYSTANNPDVIASLNIFRHKGTVKGIIASGQDFYVGTEKGIELIRIYGNEQADQDDEFLNTGLVNSKAFAKITDETIAVMSYNGPYLISNRRVIPIGKHLNEWWIDTLTKAQKEACAVGYNHLYNEVWFSFPTYTDATYTAGIIFVYDLDAEARGAKSPWWRVKTDIAIEYFELSSLLHLIGGGATEIVDFDESGTDESPDTSYRIKMVRNPVPGKRVWWDRVYIDESTDDTVSVNGYYDESASAVAHTLNADGNTFIRRIAETAELEITTAASQNAVEQRRAMLTFTPKAV